MSAIVHLLYAWLFPSYNMFDCLISNIKMNVTYEVNITFDFCYDWLSLCLRPRKLRALSRIFQEVSLNCLDRAFFKKKTKKWEIVLIISCLQKQQ